VREARIRDRPILGYAAQGHLRALACRTDGREAGRRSATDLGLDFDEELHFDARIECSLDISM
jgi:hypothetical protein